MLARYLRCHPSTIYRLLKRGQIPAFKIGSDWRFQKSVIDRWLKRSTIDSLASWAELTVPRCSRTALRPWLADITCPSPGGFDDNAYPELTPDRVGGQLW